MPLLMPLFSFASTPLYEDQFSYYVQKLAKASVLRRIGYCQPLFGNMSKITVFTGLSFFTVTKRLQFLTI